MNIEQAAKRLGEKTAVVFDTGERLTYDQLNRRSNRLAHFMRTQGARRGDVIAFRVSNSPMFFEIALGASRAGLYFVPIPTAATAAEIAHFVKESGAAALLLERADDILARKLNEYDLGGAAIFSREGGNSENGLESYDRAIADLPETPIANQSYGRDLLFSSGTTGKPKGIRKPLSEQDFDVESDEKSLAALMSGNEEIVYLVPAPLYHAAALHSALHILTLGGTVVVMSRFDAARALELIEANRVTHSQWVPAMFVKLLELPEEQRNAFDTSSLIDASHGAAPCSKQLKRAMIEWWGPIINEYYGGTEGVGACSISSEEWLRKPGSVGKAILGEIHILDDEMRPLPQGEAGHIYFSGGGAFEYLGQDGKSPGDLTSKLQSYGDIGYLDEDGYLFLTDRASDMIIAGGVNIYPREIEQALLLHDGVRDTAVFGVPHVTYGETVIALVEKSHPSAESENLRTKLLEHLEEHLSRQKIPRELVFCRDLQRGENGKIYKHKLRQQYLADGLERV